MSRHESADPNAPFPSLETIRDRLTRELSWKPDAVPEGVEIPA
jgi:hypothetical protein